MDIYEKIDQLLNITTALKKEVNEIKGNDLNSKLDDLEVEKEALKNDIIDLRQALMQQNEKILTLLRDQNEKLLQAQEADKLAYSKKISHYTKMFPIDSIQKLEEMEAYINTSNLNDLVAVVQQLITPQGVVKNMVSVLSTQCVVHCNVDGIHHKKRLLNYTKFMDLLFQAAYYDGYNQKTFLDEVRHGLKLVKNRHNKNLFRTRQLQRQEEEYRMEDYGEDSQLLGINVIDILQEEFIKEEICD